MALNFCRRGGPLSAADLVRDRWVLKIVEELMRGDAAFLEIRTALGIASNILADRLKMMTAHGLIERHESAEDQRLRCYSLTAKGRDLQPVVAAIRDWSKRHALG